MAAYKIITGDVLAELKKLSSDHFDAVLSDPPYGINFMGREWDKGVPSAEVYSELNRVLKPGAFGLHFGGTRMWHRLAVNLEDGGFEIRDTLMWLYGSGFPKSHNLGKALDKKAGATRKIVSRNPNSRENCDKSNTLYESGTVGKTAYITEAATEDAKLWEGYGTALKPAWEPCILAQKPLDGTYANNAITHHCGALNIGECRVGTDDTRSKASLTALGQGSGWNAHNNREVIAGSASGRWPANLILDEEAGEILDAQSGISKSRKNPGTGRKLDTQKMGWGFKSMPEGFEDKGGASRFFYCPKVSTAERNAGLDINFKEKTTQKYGSIRQNRGAGYAEESKAKNPHPTLKPLALTEYLARLLLPPKQKGKTRRILVPFSGAGSEMIGCLKAGWDEVWGIELSDEYVDIAHARIAHHTKAKKL